MGSWGITMRESDYGLDLLETIEGAQLKAVDFSTFNVADTLEVIKADIMEEIRQASRGCSAAELVSYFSERFPPKFTQGALLIAECLTDYYPMFRKQILSPPLKQELMYAMTTNFLHHLLRFCYQPSFGAIPSTIISKSQGRLLSR